MPHHKPDITAVFQTTVKAPDRTVLLHGLAAALRTIAVGRWEVRFGPALVYRTKRRAVWSLRLRCKPPDGGPVIAFVADSERQSPEEILADFAAFLRKRDPK